MNGSSDTAGVAFAALIFALAIPFAVVYFRQRQTLDPLSRTTGMVLLAAGVLDGGVNVVRKMGLMPDNAVYWTLDISLLTLFWVMLLFFLRAQGRREKAA